MRRLLQQSFKLLESGTNVTPLECLDRRKRLVFDGVQPLLLPAGEQRSYADNRTDQQQEDEDRQSLPETNLLRPGGQHGGKIQEQPLRHGEDESDEWPGNPSDAVMHRVGRIKRLDYSSVTQPSLALFTFLMYLYSVPRVAL